MIEPHGGSLVNRIATQSKMEDFNQKLQDLPRLFLNSKEISDLEMMAVGAFSPLTGFLNKKDYLTVIENKRLSNGLVWSLPITLSVSKEEAKSLKEGTEIALLDNHEILRGILNLEDKYTYDKRKESDLIFGTSDREHPGVNRLFNQGEVLIGGDIILIEREKFQEFNKYRLDPLDTRELIDRNNWRKTVAFQTRNPIHRAHEYIQKCALELVDGLLLHPLVGETKDDDVPARIRMACYEAILEYYPKNRTLLSVFPAAMRYAGPREAVFHAIVRKNYGCTHFIVGRNHAGVGNYYGDYDAQHIFDEFETEDIGITPMFF